MVEVGGAKNGGYIHVGHHFLDLLFGVLQAEVAIAGQAAEFDALFIGVSPKLSGCLRIRGGQLHVGKAFNDGHTPTGGLVKHIVPGADTGEGAGVKCKTLIHSKLPNLSLV